MADIGYYTLPVILSFKGIDSQVEASLGKSMQDLGKKTGEQFGPAVVATLDPTKSPKLNTAIKSTSGAGKKLGDAITTEVAKNIDGKKISDKMSASVTTAVQGTAGKKMGEAITKSVEDSVKGTAGKKMGDAVATSVREAVKNGAGKDMGEAVTTEIAKNIDGKKMGAKIREGVGDALGTLARVESGEAFTAVGKRISGRIAEGLKGANIPQAIKAAIDSDAGRDIGNAIGARVGKAIGEQVMKIPGAPTAVDVIKESWAPGAQAIQAGQALKGGEGGDYGALIKDAVGILNSVNQIMQNVEKRVPALKSFDDQVKESPLNEFFRTHGGEWLADQLGIEHPKHVDTTVVNEPVVLDSQGRPLGPDGKPMGKDFLKPSEPPPAPLGRGWRAPPPPPAPPAFFGPEGPGGPRSVDPKFVGPTREYRPPPQAIPGMSEAVTGVANVHANSASISVGSATISGVSVPAYSGSGSGATPVRQGFKSWYATGGAIDNVPIMATVGEHMLTTADVAALGGQQGVYDFRRALHHNGGGPIGPPPPPPTWGRGVPPPWLRRPGPNRAAIKGVYYGGAIGYDDGGEIKQLGEAIAGPVAKAAAEGAAKGAEGAAHGAGGGMALPAILGGAGGQQMGADIATQLLGIGAGGVGETLGLGTLFPDPMNNPNVRSLMALASAFKGPIMGAMKGKLGIQQPGWRPGMSVDAMAGDTGAGASIGLPFGLPSIDLPGAPEGGGAPPGGGPVGGGDTNIDASLTIHGDVGSDKALRDHQQQMQRGVDRLGPMPTGPN